MKNGTIVEFNGEKLQVIGKFADGRIILQGTSGIQIWLNEKDLITK
jgi:hypothetical protein